MFDKQMMIDAAMPLVVVLVVLVGLAIYEKHIAPKIEAQKLEAQRLEADRLLEAQNK